MIDNYNDIESCLSCRDSISLCWTDRPFKNLMKFPPDLSFRKFALINLFGILIKKFPIGCGDMHTFNIAFLSSVIQMP